MRSERRHVGKVLRHAKRDALALEPVERREAKTARRHKLIEAVRFQEVFSGVDRDGKSDAVGVDQFHSNDADREPVPINQRTAAVPRVQRVGDLQIAPFPGLTRPKRRDCARRRADLRHQVGR